MKVPRDLIRQLPDLDELVERYDQEAMEEAFGLPFQAEAEARSAKTTELPAIQQAADEMRRRVIEVGRRTIRKIHDEGPDVELDLEEQVGLEAIVAIEGRPAILIQDGHFLAPPIKWQILDDKRDSIERTCQSVGRVEVEGHPSYDYVGTGFLVAEDVIMTNRHVAEIFAQKQLRSQPPSASFSLLRFLERLFGIQPRQEAYWEFKAGMTPRVDYVEELGAPQSAEFAIEGVIGVHEVFDLALLRVAGEASTAGGPPPQPLEVAAEPAEVGPGSQVYVVGYPAWDGRRNDPEHMRQIFSNIFNVKRLQPGEMRQVLDGEGLFIHDCSTLGGNSGSCVVELESNRVVGLHFGGRYLKGNSAVALWKLVDDPLLKEAGVNFV
jgi:V8-like Glu-specific endopeptidase